MHSHRLRRRLIPRVAFAFAGAWIVVACGLDPVAATVAEQDAAAGLAEAVCTARYDCPCPDPPWPDRETCVQQQLLRFEDASAIAQAHALDYDGVCVASRLDVFAVAGCEVDVEPPACPPCRPYVGRARAGQACERLGITVDVDTCAQGLRCEAGRCVDACPAPVELGEGRRCLAGVAELGVCAEGLYCVADTERCTPAPAVGEPCPDGTCVDEAYCDRGTPGSFVCVRKTADAGPCALGSECVSGSCLGGVCDTTPAAACTFP